jgi:hypothetical protein
LTQRGGTFLFDSQGKLIYEHRDRGILSFAENMSNPLLSAAMNKCTRTTSWFKEVNAEISS